MAPAVPIAPPPFVHPPKARCLVRSQSLPARPACLIISPPPSPLLLSPFVSVLGSSVSSESSNPFQPRTPLSQVSYQNTLSDDSDVPQLSHSADTTDSFHRRRFKAPPRVIAPIPPPPPEGVPLHCPFVYWPRFPFPPLPWRPQPPPPPPGPPPP